MPNRFFVASVIVLGLGGLMIFGVQPAHTQFGGGRSVSRPIPEISGSMGVPMRTVQSAEAAMASHGTWHFDQVPLDELIAKLRTALQINVQLDTESLSEEGIGTDTPISMQLRDVPLEVALEYSLRSLQLQAYVDRNILVVTTLAKAKDMLETRVYPVYELVVFQSPNGERFEDYQSLMNLIEQETSGPWMNTAGEGGATAELANAGAIVIRQTRMVHREIAGLLSALRKAKRVQQLPDIPVVIPCNGQPDYRGLGFFSVDDELEEGSEGRIVNTPLTPHAATLSSVPHWQVPRIDRAK